MIKNFEENIHKKKKSINSFFQKKLDNKRIITNKKDNESN